MVFETVTPPLIAPPVPARDVTEFPVSVELFSVTPLEATYIPPPPLVAESPEMVTLVRVAVVLKKEKPPPKMAELPVLMA